MLSSVLNSQTQMYYAMCLPFYIDFVHHEGKLVIGNDMMCVRQ